MKTFKAATRKVESKEVKFQIESSVKGARTMVAHRPKDAIFAEVVRRNRTGASTAERLEGTHVFFGGEEDEQGERVGGVLSPTDWKWLKNRLADPHEDLDLDILMEMIQWLIEELSGTPTTSPTDS